MEFKTRKIIMHPHLNATQSLFGGQALAWIDEEAAVFAACHLGTSSIVTKFISEIDFKSPAHLGDIIEIGCEVVKVGLTSITVRCVMRNMNCQKEIIQIDKIVFVHINPEGTPTPHGKQ